MTINSRWGNVLKDVWKDSLEISFELFKVMIPVVILVKILQELGAITVLGEWLTPLMQFLRFAWIHRFGLGDCIVY